ncbi:MAG: PstS family phosphate ABC transporter substrate-binding protein [Actinobacteria bacterium]|nr:PstS family phosphate ABC transporter substrate-binding protein [Actinomycetota bacterium]
MKSSSNRIWILTIVVILLLVFSISGALSGCRDKAEPGETGDRDTAPADNTGYRFKDRELVIQGSDTLLEVSMYWVETFSNANPGVNISVTGGGSGTGIAALINNTVDFANASRSIKDAEIETAKSRGIDIQEFTVAWDGISVVINIDNPITELSIEQISKIFTGEITNWNKVGGDDGEIVVTSRDSSSGTFGYFKERVVQMDGAVKENDYTQMALFLASNAAIREEVSTNKNAIGYIGLGYLDDSLKAVSIIGEETSGGVAPSAENIQNGSYPISRPLYIYAQGIELTDLEQAFIDFVMGEEGQEIARDIGFVPLI